jgi:hypothetical protein
VVTTLCGCSTVIGADFGTYQVAGQADESVPDGALGSGGEAYWEPPGGGGVAEFGAGGASVGREDSGAPAGGSGSGGTAETGGTGSGGTVVGNGGTVWVYGGATGAGGAFATGGAGSGGTAGTGGSGTGGDQGSTCANCFGALKPSWYTTGTAFCSQAIPGIECSHYCMNPRTDLPAPGTCGGCQVWFGAGANNNFFCCNPGDLVKCGP